ncbi:hypothetical protein BZA70DRAFT_282132, partial [Myxozyma melibiosi]
MKQQQQQQQQQRPQRQVMFTPDHHAVFSTCFLHHDCFGFDKPLAGPDKQSIFRSTRYIKLAADYGYRATLDSTFFQKSDVRRQIHYVVRAISACTALEDLGDHRRAYKHALEVIHAYSTEPYAYLIAEIVLRQWGRLDDAMEMRRIAATLDMQTSVLKDERFVNEKFVLKVHSRLFETHNTKQMNRRAKAVASRAFTFFHASASTAVRVVKRNSFSGEDRQKPLLIDKPSLIDPIAHLPSEIGELILSYVDFRQRYALQRVSKLWQRAIERSWWLCRSIDFRGCYCVPGRVVLEAIAKNKGAVVELHLENIVVTDVEHIAYSVFHDDYESRFYTENEERGIVINSERGVNLNSLAKPDYDSLRNLKVLTMDYPFGMISPFIYNAPDPGLHFRHLASQLTELQISATNSSPVVWFFSHGNLPNLRVFKILSPHTVKSLKSEDLYNPSSHDNRADEKVTSTQLRVFEIGAPLPDNDAEARDLFEFNSSIKRLQLSQADLISFLDLVPNLEELRVRMCEVTDSAYRPQAEPRQGDDEGEGDGEAAFQGIAERARAYFPSLPNLQVFDFSWSRFGPPIAPPPQCRVLNLNCSSGLRDDPEFTLERMIASRTFELLPSQGLRSLTNIGLACEQRRESAEEMLLVLGRVLGSSAVLVEGINLNGNRQIDYRSLNKEATDGSKKSLLRLQNRRRKLKNNSSESLEEGCFLSDMAELFPELKSLAIGHNKTLGDKEVMSVRLFSKLQFLDICCSSVTVQGLVSLLFGKKVATLISSDGSAPPAAFSSAIADAIKAGEKLGEIETVWVRGCVKIPIWLRETVKRFEIDLVDDKYVSQQYGYPLFDADGGGCVRADVPGWSAYTPKD